jgi:hypothetical protein
MQFIGGRGEEGSSKSHRIEMNNSPEEAGEPNMSDDDIPF